MGDLLLQKIWHAVYDSFSHQIGELSLAFPSNLEIKVYEPGGNEVEDAAAQKIVEGVAGSQQSQSLYLLFSKQQ